MFLANGVCWRSDLFIQTCTTFVMFRHMAPVADHGSGGLGRFSCSQLSVPLRQIRSA